MSNVTPIKSPYPDSVETDSVMVACPTYRGKAYACLLYTSDAADE